MNEIKQTTTRNQQNAAVRTKWEGHNNDLRKRDPSADKRKEGESTKEGKMKEKRH